MSSNDQRSPRSARGADASGVEPRVLVWILDDSPMEAMMARRALAPRYDVETFEDGSVLLERLAVGQPPSVLVLDWQLPGMSGIEVCRFLRSTRNEMELPILMLTVYGHRSDLVDGLQAGANDYLTKPYDPPELVARVGTLGRIHTLYEEGKRAEVERADLLTREREARADAEAANIAKDDFLTMVSHELRTPLNAILGWTRMVRAGGLSEEQVARAMATVERSATAQTQLIEDLLDMSRVISGKLTIEREALDFANLVRSEVDAIRPSAANKSIELDVRISPDGAQILGDPARLRQVIGNLLTNALKFTPKGGRVATSLGVADDSLELAVADSGKGITAEFLPKVFDRFKQAERGSKRAYGGLGLGLTIVKHIVDLHGGSVEARSLGEGRGATFVVTLPRRPSEAPRAPVVAPSARALLSSPLRLSGLRVLLVDDDPDALELLSTVVEHAGAQILSASSAADAFALLKRDRPDVLVSDIGMPLRDGYELIRDIRAMPVSEGGLTPALALTAFARGADRTRTLASGFNLYATKPIEPDDLVVFIANLAGRFDAS